MAVLETRKFNSVSNRGQIFCRKTEIWNEVTGEGRVIQTCENCDFVTGGPQWVNYFSPLILLVEPDFCLNE